MTNYKHLNLLLSGADKWNLWRANNPTIYTNFKSADLRSTNLSGSDLKGIDFTRANLTGANLSSADLRGAILYEANLTETNLMKSDLRNTILNGRRLKNANLSGANLRGLNLGGEDLSSVYLTNSDLCSANLSAARLSGAKLSGAKLKDTDLSSAFLKGADLTGANLTGADLTGANLTDANLSKTFLYKTILNETVVIGTSFKQAKFGNTQFGNLDLTECKGLEECYHMSKSIIDYHTLQRSKNLPVVFLRGCGLSDTYIDYVPSLFEIPIQFYYCFISYSTKDHEFADRLFTDLQSRGIRVWFAPHDMKAGKKMIDQIDIGIKVTDKLLLVLSKNSIGSDWVKTEISKAYKKSKQIGKKVLFPISITSFDNLLEWEQFDSDLGKDLAKEIREFYVLDFENWKDEKKYGNSFDKLVEGLRINTRLQL
ncbi:MAG: toll/interleukin-1 receptor domain-containing protein [Bacteroidales bacterium]|nr:toll/interleukin-1 receptor domain-containing protein [Bacteroidales bacterium]